MKITSIALLGIIPFLFGCASTTITKTYSADFKVIPKETKDVGEVSIVGGLSVTNKQHYIVKGEITEVTRNEQGEVLNEELFYAPTLSGSEGSKFVFRTSFTQGSKKNPKIKVEHSATTEALIEERDDGISVKISTIFRDDDVEMINCSQSFILKN